MLMQYVHALTPWMHMTQKQGLGTCSSVSHAGACVVGPSRSPGPDAKAQASGQSAPAATATTATAAAATSATATAAAATAATAAAATAAAGTRDLSATVNATAAP